jgi:DNA-directed RNA polymerase subunit RPC12/RpoP
VKGGDVMAARLNHCPECNSRQLEVVKEHDPETSNMNMRVTFKCADCGHIFEGRKTSHHHTRMRRKGWAI